MRRTDYPSIAEISREVMQDLVVEQRVKTAERAILRRAEKPTSPQGTTALSQDLLKLASQLRNSPDDEVTYTDINQFMSRLNVAR